MRFVGQAFLCHQTQQHAAPPVTDCVQLRARLPVRAQKKFGAGTEKKKVQNGGAKRNEVPTESIDRGASLLLNGRSSSYVAYE